MFAGGGSSSGSVAHEKPPMSVAHEKPPMSVFSVVDYLLSEWRSWERERARWTNEKSTLESRVSTLEGEKAALLRVQSDLIRRIRMLEVVLQRERGNTTTRTVEPDADESVRIEVPSDVAELVRESTTRLQGRKPSQARTLLQRYLDEIATTDAEVPVEGGAGARPADGGAAANGGAAPALSGATGVAVAAAAPAGSASGIEQAAKPVVVRKRATFDERAAPPPASLPPANGTYASGASADSAGGAATATGAAVAGAASGSSALSGSAGVAAGAAASPSAMLTAVATSSTAAGPVAAAGAPVSWTPVIQLRNHLDTVQSVFFVDDYVVTACWDGAVRMFQPGTFQSPQTEPVVVFRGHEGAALSVCEYEPATVVSGGADGTVRLWSVPAEPELYMPLDSLSSFESAVMVGHTDYVWSVLRIVGTSVVASASADGTVRLWRPRDASPLVHNVRVAPGGAQGGCGCACGLLAANTGAQLAVGTRSGQVSFIDCDRGAAVRSVKLPAACVGLAQDADSGLLLATSSDGRLSYVDPRSGASQWLVHACVAHPAAASSVAVLPGAGRAVTGGHDGSMRTWDIGSRQMLHEAFAHHSKRGVAVTCVATGSVEFRTVVASAGADSLVKVWREE